MSKAMISDARLTALWNRRGELGEPEWAELYGIVDAVLRKSRGSLFDGLQDEREDYIHAFFLQKVLAPKNTGEGREMSRGYLLGFFGNFLRDQRDMESRRPGLFNTVSIADDGADADKEHGDGRRFDFSPDQVEETLAHSHLTGPELTDSARRFFNRLQEWQRQALGRHLCAEFEYALPLSQLQEQYPKTATYYKVKQLGIIHSTRSVPADYHKTTIGRWLTAELGLTLDPDSHAILHIALQVLCLVALQILDD